MPELTPEQQQLVDRIRELARSHFAPRAAQYDQRTVFPKEDFDDLFRAGLHAAAVPDEYGGLGLGPQRRRALALWMLTREIARVDLSLTRCWESHVNALVMLDGMANPRQKERWFPGVVERGELWGAWGGEPQARGPDESMPFGTQVTKTHDGYVVDGTKVFCTGAGALRWALLMVSTAGPGGIRHATGAAETQLLLACDLADSSITIDTSWWEPIGMRSTTSHLVRFHQTHIPEAQVVGYPGQFIKEAWQTRFTPQYAVGYLGAAEGAFDFARAYLRSQQKGGDPYVQHHVGQMAVNVATGDLWIRQVAALWDTGQVEEAQLAGAQARHAIEQLAADTLEHAIRACGARCLNRPSSLERIYRDLTFYLRHDNDDHLLATIGRSVLGEAFDPSFFRPPAADRLR
jgi:alkylation response protein AidB-like acyl-CoA dehydrogenase